MKKKMLSMSTKGHVNKGLQPLAIIIIVVLMAIVGIQYIGPLYAAVPKVLNYQGKLLDSDGVGLNDTLNITFKLYTAETGGDPIWTETIDNVEISKGLFSVELGTSDGFDTLSFAQPYWLEIEVAGETLTPRERLTSAPYALRAGTADRGLNPVYSDSNATRRTGNFVFRAGEGATLSDDGNDIHITIGGTVTPGIHDVLTASNNAGGEQIKNLAEPTEAQDAATRSYVDNAVSSSGDVTGPTSSTDNGIVRFDGTTGKVIQNSADVVIDDAGNVGIGTTNPGYKLDLHVPAATNAIRVRRSDIANDVITLKSESRNEGTLQLFNSGLLGTRITATGNHYFKYGNVGIGTTDPEYKLDVNGDLNLKTSVLRVAGSVGSDGQVLTSTGSGVAWEDPAGGGDCPDGFTDTGCGYCIQTNENSALNWHDASEYCRDNYNARLCTCSEWYNACTDSTDLGLSNMTGNWEWVDSWYNNEYALVRGSSACGSCDYYFAYGYYELAFRCCRNK